MKQFARTARRSLGWFIVAGGNFATLSMLAQHLAR